MPSFQFHEMRFYGEVMEVMYPRCAGLHVHKGTVVACVQRCPRDANGNPIGQYRYEASAANRALELIGKELGMTAKAATPRACFFYHRGATDSNAGVGTGGTDEHPQE